MTGQVTLVPLRGHRVVQAFPVVRHVAPETTIDAWLNYARGFVRSKARRDAPQDIIAACSDNDYLRGLYAYRVVPELGHTRALVAECFVVSSLFFAETVAAALLAGIEQAARAYRCDAVRIELVAPPEWLVAMLREGGYDHRSCSLHKALSAGSGAPDARLAGGRAPSTSAPPDR